MKKIFSLMVAIALMFAAAARAENVCCAGEEWCPPSAGPVTTWAAPLCGKGKLLLSPAIYYNRARGSFDDDGIYGALSGSDRKYQFQQQFFVQYGVTDRFEIDAQTVYQENFIKRGGISAHHTGIGDSYLYPRYCLVEESKVIPHLCLLGQLKIPTGKYQHGHADKLGTDMMGAGSGGGSWDQGLGVILTKKVRPCIFHADFIYSVPQRVRVDGAGTRYGDYINADIGVEYFLPRGFNLMIEANGFFQGEKKVNGERVQASDVNYGVLAPGIGWSNQKIQTLLAYQRVVAGTNTDANDSIVATCVYTF
ncbi:MAG: transporter [Candidatus Omnitrophota bacterium]